MASFGAPPDYYGILGVSDKATQQQIRDAYKRAALKHHPDRVPDSSPEREARTHRFQLVNDAYYTLSDATRRRDYDIQRRMHPSSKTRPGADPFASPSAGGGRYTAPEPESESEEEGAGFTGFPGGFPSGAGTDTGTGAGAGAAAGGGIPFSWAWNFFTGQGGGGAGAGGAAPFQDRRQTEEEQFRDVFEEMLHEEGLADQAGHATSRFWSMIGGMSGGALGFIMANVAGMVAGAVAGNRLGAVRDARGKSVYAVFQELPQDDRARLLSQLAAKVFSHATGL